MEQEYINEIKAGKKALSRVLNALFWGGIACIVCGIIQFIAA